MSAWRTLNAAGGHCPALDPDFVAPLLAHFGSGKERLAIAGPPDDPIAMTLLSPIGGGKWQTFQPSQAPLGCWVVRPGTPWPALSRSLLACLPGYSLVIGLSQLDPDIVPRPVESGPLRTLDYIQTARVTVNGNFEGYWSARGKNLRHNLKRQGNRLKSENIAWRLDELTEPADMAAAVAEFGKFESAGWKAGGGTAIHADNTQGRFYRAMLENFAQRAGARVFRYVLAGRTAALDLCIVQAGTLIILKTTYDETITGFSPAMLMRYEAFQRLFADVNIHRIEFYGKVMDWHTKWSNEIRTLYHLNVYRYGFLPTLLNCLSRSKAPVP